MPAFPDAARGLYAILDPDHCAGRDPVRVAEAILAGGCAVLQLRSKTMEGRAMHALAVSLRERARAAGVPFVVNDRIDVALAVLADGVHLPATSFSPGNARRLLGPDALIGVSTHGLDEAGGAQRMGADFIVCGPIFDTPSKRAFGPPVGLEALAEVTRAISIPVLAIGGITAEQAPATRGCGVHGIAVISAILEAADPCAAARALRKAISNR